MHWREISYVLVEVLISKNKRADFINVFVEADVKERTVGEVVIYRDSHTHTDVGLLSASAGCMK